MIWRRILLTEVPAHPLEPNRKQRITRQVAGQLDHLVHQFAGIVHRLQGLAKVVVAGEPLRAMVQFHEIDRAVRKAVDAPALLQRIRQVLRVQAGERHLAVLVEVEHGVGVRGDVGVVDGVQADSLRIPVVGVLLQAQAGAMHPAGDDERAVVEQLVGIRPVAAAGGLVERLVDRVVGGERGELVEERYRAGEIHFQRATVHRSHRQRFELHFAPIHRLRVLDAVEDEGVLRGVGRFQHLAPAEDEILRRHRGAVAPLRVLAQMEGRALGTYVPPLGHAGRQVAARVVAQEALHHMAENAKAHLIRAPSGVELRRLLAEGQGHRARCGIGRLTRAAGIPQRQHPKHRCQHRHASGREAEQLPKGAEIDLRRHRGSRRFRHCRLRHQATLRNRLPTTRFRCMSELHSSAWWT